MLRSDSRSGIESPYVSSAVIRDFGGGTGFCKVPRSVPAWFREFHVMPRPLDPRTIELLDADMVRVLRALTPAQRLAAAFDCQRTARLVIAGHLRDAHPDWDENQVQAEIARRMLGGTG